jgi:hypothetical protein
MNGPAFEGRSPDSGAAPHSNGMLLYEFHELFRVAVMRGRTVARAVIAEHRRPIAFAELAGGLDERVEHQLKVESRTADDFENVSGCDLLLACFV